ncbi:4Fe-4S dicluster domain-containing protein [Moorella sulfitireducens]|uniref:4Fe-4S dicluster domain-containing protein n=1 Tax=Neomoorella sulfitireducens TaxID=2972948 RepID=UPI0021AD47D9|nr:ferredoxin family protein [Moorella sulfitireducens]
MPPVIDPKKCVHCGTCAQICCMDVYGPAKPQTVPQVRYPEECWHCRACVMDCPAGAIELTYPLPMMILCKDAPARGEGGDRP